ncbi:MAG: SCO1664 family protein [Actinomycetes bacterium]
MSVQEPTGTADNVLTLHELAMGEIDIEGRLVEASNATLFGSIHVDDHSRGNVIYKPVSGERPLWDFPHGTLAQREVAAYELSEALGWDLVPPTLLREGPYGLGMVQSWIQIDEEVEIVEVAQGDHPDIIRMALFDALINNTDRKFGHLLPIGGRIYGCDHGVTFHQEDKLRTVLWQFRGNPIPQGLLADLDRLETVLPILEQLIHPEEIAALLARRESLLTSGTYPLPSQDWPAVPWPPF